MGLNGYTDKLLSELDSDSGKVRARVPTTLQSLDDEAEQRRAAQRRSREAESEKWDSIRREVEERREKEQERERNYVHEARQQMVRLSKFVLRSNDDTLVLTYSSSFMKVTIQITLLLCMPFKCGIGEPIDLPLV